MPGSVTMSTQGKVGSGRWTAGSHSRSWSEAAAWGSPNRKEVFQEGHDMEATTGTKDKQIEPLTCH